MASFLASDSPVADFDYDEPAAVDIVDATVALDVAGQTLPAEADGQAVRGSWSTLDLPAVGRYPVYVLVASGERTQRVLVDWLVVVDPADEWYNAITARLDWAGAPEPDGIIARLLEVAREQVEEYGPNLPAGTPVPERYRSAQLVQARNTWNASLTNGDAQVDVGGFVVNVRPLDWAVKQLIRPLTATKAVG
ncbi:hypothetical protein Q7F20_07580 [Curtobacterium sp. A7_M15]|uniref:hypothetical protein n=1 Tax=Curtobacterium sp. A7_M15 TaxID=3065241 RepID=UPI002737E15E|nr:hypothetical protein [Curtobacterium sp. A7_M15]MDP4333229.1 hypothetical protein [Curtobacterium sp. A7_M15]